MNQLVRTCLASGADYLYKSAFINCQLLFLKNFRPNFLKRNPSIISFFLRVKGNLANSSS